MRRVADWAILRAVQAGATRRSRLEQLRYTHSVIDRVLGMALSQGWLYRTERGYEITRMGSMAILCAAAGYDRETQPEVARRLKGERQSGG